jgi:hypothetical protein
MAAHFRPVETFADFYYNLSHVCRQSDICRYIPVTTRDASAVFFPFQLIKRESTAAVA